MAAFSGQLCRFILGFSISANQLSVCEIPAEQVTHKLQMENKNNDTAGHSLPSLPAFDWQH
jgi:hypothetical protein